MKGDSLLDLKEDLNPIIINKSRDVSRKPRDAACYFIGPMTLLVQQ